MQQQLSTSPIYKKGTFFERWLALVVDWIILIIPTLLLVSFFGVNKKYHEFFLWLFSVIYGTLFIWQSGATPGKKLLKLKVVKLNSYQPVGFGAALLRESIGKILSNLVLFSGYTWMLIDKKRQTWHDKLAKTLVVKLDKSKNFIPIEKEETVSKKQKIVVFSLVIIVLILSLAVAFFFWRLFLAEKRGLEEKIEVETSEYFPKTSSFVYLFGDEIWWTQASDDNSKLTTEIIANNVLEGFSISPKKDKLAYIAETYLKVNTIKEDEEKILQQVLPADYLDFEGPFLPDYFAAVMFDTNISWSPDGEALAFIGSHDGQADIYTIDIKGEKLQKLTNDERLEFYTRWSPDGKKIVFQVADSFGTGLGAESDIFVVDADGSNLLEVGRFYTTLASTLQWLNSGEIIYCDGHVMGAESIKRANVKTGKSVRLVDQPTFGTVDPKWSESAKKYLYPVIGKLLIVSGNGDIATIETKFEVNGAVWSHDGQKIAYSVYSSSNSKNRDNDLFVANADGTGIRKIATNSKAGALRPFVFSSDDKKVFYVSKDEKLWMVNSDGTDDRQISSPKGELFFSLHASPHEDCIFYSGNEEDTTAVYYFNLENMSKEVIGRKSGCWPWIQPVFLGK